MKPAIIYVVVAGIAVFDPDEVTKYPADTAVLVRRPKTIHWVRRCLHPAKR